MRLFFITLIFFTLSLQAKHINWQGDFEKSRQRALQEQKYLLVLLIETNSAESQKVIQTTFINQAYISRLNREFVAVLVTKGQKSSYPIEMLYTFLYPSLFFLDSHELFIHDPIRGNVTPKTVKLVLKEINSTHK